MTKIEIAYDRVQVLDGLVPTDIYEELLALVPRIGWQYGWVAQNLSARYWHHEIAGGAKANTLDVTHNVARHGSPVFARYADWLHCAMVPEGSRLLRLYLNGHTFGTDGSPHTDTDRPGEVTLLLYLNRNWRPEFGGETVVFDQAGEIANAVMPKENRLLAFPSERLHAPRPLSKLFGGLRVVLVAKFGLGAATSSDVQPTRNQTI